MTYRGPLWILPAIGVSSSSILLSILTILGGTPELPTSQEGRLLLGNHQFLTGVDLMTWRIAGVVEWGMYAAFALTFASAFLLLAANAYGWKTRSERDYCLMMLVVLPLSLALALVACAFAP